MRMFVLYSMFSLCLEITESVLIRDEIRPPASQVCCTSRLNEDRVVPKCSMVIVCLCTLAAKSVVQTDLSGANSIT